MVSLLHASVNVSLTDNAEKILDYKIHRERCCYGDPGVFVWEDVNDERADRAPNFQRRHCYRRSLLSAGDPPLHASIPGAISAGFIFMDDKARPRRTPAVQELQESELITRRHWPVYSPDLNPIEHVRDALGRRL
ncbi:hypothetical protein AVEN_214498-1 [Araneus ventricosus]|uniref:Tc1-like transposase DDE domain-containing protein n=1 Tax=Araneus ventricosus TaxID=182803 RepID=A0A4Y2CW53_ARAVE|nr:hypothetical protein AVEN_214498-1 [Araneus ventricosus]